MGFRLLRSVIVYIFVLCYSGIFSTAYTDETKEIKPFDLLEIRFFPQSELSREVYVDQDGDIFIDFLGYVKVEGLKPDEAATKLENVLKTAYLRKPTVIVRIKNSGTNAILIIGEVQKPGRVNYHKGMSLMEAISKAGGLTELALFHNIRIVRTIENKEKSIYVDIERMFEDKKETFILKPGDIIVIPQRKF